MKILDIKPIAKLGKILVTTAESDIWITAGQWKNKGCSNSIGNYVGGDIEVDFYQEGDDMFGGAKCTKSNTIHRDFFISANPVVLANVLAIESASAMEALSGVSALASRRKAEERAKLTVANEALNA